MYVYICINIYIAAKKSVYDPFHSQGAHTYRRCAYVIHTHNIRHEDSYGQEERQGVCVAHVMCARSRVDTMLSHSLLLSPPLPSSPFLSPPLLQSVPMCHYLDVSRCLYIDVSLCLHLSCCLCLVFGGGQVSDGDAVTIQAEADRSVVTCHISCMCACERESLCGCMCVCVCV